MFKNKFESFATKAFTLIELLVVVAIIAILAAIAVPNFQEAQTRAKVSRTKADMRSLGVATSAYWADWNEGPRCFPDIYCEIYAPLWSPIPNNIYYKALTTPVGYIAKFPKTVSNRLFWNESYTNAGGTDAAKIKALEEMYWFNNFSLMAKYSSNPANKGYSVATNSGDVPNKPTTLDDCFNSYPYIKARSVGYLWLFADCGPNISPYNSKYLEYYWVQWKDTDGTYNKHCGAINFPSYDPTNGTKSVGYIVYTNKGFYTIDSSLNYGK